MRKLLLLGVCLLASVRATPPEWRSSHSADGRFLVQGPVPEWVQGVSVWASRSLKLLERETGTHAVFVERARLRIVLHPEATETRLHETNHRGVLHQEIVTPGKDRLDTRGLADAFTRAILHRMAPRTAESASAPDWLVFGLSHLLIEGETESLSLAALDAWHRGELPATDHLTRSPNLPDTELNRALCVHITHMLLRPGQGPAMPVSTLLQGPPMDLNAWVRHRPGVLDVRELNMDRDLWLFSRERGLISEMRAEALAAKRWEQLLRFRPGEYGLAGEEVPRHQVFTLRELAEHVDSLWLAPMLQQWMMRVQPVRFRQSEAFTQGMDPYLEATRHLLRATHARGRRRQQALERFYKSMDELPE